MATVEALQAEVADLRRQVAELQATVKALLAENAALRAENTVLKAEVASLKGRLGMDSSNSSKPPSTDSPFKRPPPQPSTGKRPGAQRGHKGRYRRQAATADVMETVAPCACAHCGEALGAGDVTGRPFVREIVDIEVKHHVRHIELLAAKCPKCRKKTRAQAPAGTPTGAFGPQVQATVGLMTMQGISRGDAQKLLKSMFDLDMSIGSIDKACTDVERSVDAAVEQVAKHIGDAAVAHADETGWHVRGKLGWLWSALAKGAEYFRFDPKRDRDALRALVGEFSGLLHSDRWGPYKLFAPEMRQLCHAHLRRDIQALIDADGADTAVGKRLLELSNEMFALWHAFERKEIDAAALENQMVPVKSGWEAAARTLAQRPQGKGRALGRSLLALWPALWNFVEYELVQPTNNEQEQGLRKAVKIRKNSFGSTSEAGAKRMAALLTVLGTARRQGVHLLRWLADALDRRTRGLAPPLLLPVGAGAA